jgi:hypothetical protein
MYDRLDATESTSIWDFTKYSPDIVVISLFQNDSWLVKMPEHEQFKYRFGAKAPDENFIVESYKHFVEALRNKYANASIICVLSNMDATRKRSPWPGYVQQALNNYMTRKFILTFSNIKIQMAIRKLLNKKQWQMTLLNLLRITLNGNILAE